MILEIIEGASCTRNDVTFHVNIAHTSVLSRLEIMMLQIIKLILTISWPSSSRIPAFCLSIALLKVTDFWNLIVNPVVLMGKNHCYDGITRTALWPAKNSHVSERYNKNSSTYGLVLSTKLARIVRTIWFSITFTTITDTAFMQGKKFLYEHNTFPPCWIVLKLRGDWDLSPVSLGLSWYNQEIREKHILNQICHTINDKDVSIFKDIVLLNLRR